MRNVCDWNILPKYRIIQTGIPLNVDLLIKIYNRDTKIDTWIIQCPLSESCKRQLASHIVITHKQNIKSNWELKWTSLIRIYLKNRS